jgi:hypothetical protein
VSYPPFSEPLTAEARAEVYRAESFHRPILAFPVMNPQKVVLGMMMALSFAAIVFPKQTGVNSTVNAPSAQHVRLLAMERPSSSLGRR